MTHRLPGTAPLDIFRFLSGRYLSVLLDGTADTMAEMEIAQLFRGWSYAEIKDLTVNNGTSWPAACKLPTDGYHHYLHLFEDWSVVLVEEHASGGDVLPLGVRLDRTALGADIARAFSPRRVAAGHSPLSAAELAQADSADLNSMLYSADCLHIVREIQEEAKRIMEAFAELGALQADPSNEDAGVFVPLRGRVRKQGMAELTPWGLHGVLQAELNLLVANVPFLANEAVELCVSFTVPNRDGTLPPPQTHLLVNSFPMDWEVASLIQPVVDALCASETFLPDRVKTCVYRAASRDEHDGTPQPVLSGWNMMTIQPSQGLTGHELIEQAQMRNHARKQHAEAIRAFAEALDVPWDAAINDHANRYEEITHG